MPVKALAALAGIAACCALLLAVTDRATRATIAANRTAYEERALRELIGPATLPASGWQGDVWPLCDSVVLHRVTEPGYGGPLRVLAAVAHAMADAGPPRIRGVRVTAHQETPGIADFVDHPESGWLEAVRGRSATGLAAVDAVAGATITSRALARALVRALADPTPPADCPAGEAPA